jgi:hypothetical protein
MPPRNKTRINRQGFFIFIAIAMVALGISPAAHAGVNDVLLGAAGSQTHIDFSTIDGTTFSDVFVYNGTSIASLTIGGNTEAQIGAVYTGGSAGNWYQMRVIVDSNGDGLLEPFDWSDPSHPWNRPDNGTPDDPGDDPTSWSYTYPADYPRADLQGQSITMNWDQTTMMVTGFPWDTFDMWWYEGDADKTDAWWMEAGQLMNVWWSGRDQSWSMLPNGNYLVQVWVDEDNNGSFDPSEAHKEMRIAIETAGITGSVEDAGGSPVAGARVEAGSHMAWGETRTDSNGDFVLSGLQAGADYHLRVQAEGKVTYEGQVPLGAGTTTADAGTIVLSDAIAITGTLKLDQDADGVYDEVEDRFQAFTNMWGWQQSDLWIWVDGWNMNGPGWGNSNVRFEVGDTSKDFSINIPPPGSGAVNYQINLHAEGYAVTPLTVTVDANGGNAGTIALTKASLLSGSVRLPVPTDQWKHIDVQAVSTADTGIRYWGWGQIDPYQNGGQSTDTGQFRIDGIPAGTYTLEVRVMGYATTTVNNVQVVQGQDKNVGELNVTEGLKIAGTLTITGDTSDLQRWPGDSTDGDLSIWIDAWSPSGGWSGTQVSVSRGANQTVAYSLGGLSDGNYEIHTWIGEGYELTDDQGNTPVMVSVSGANITKNIVLRQHEGIITGTVAGSGITIDLNQVVIEAKRPWDWLPPKFATVANGGINPSTGVYAIGGLGTGDYVLKAGVYTGYSDYMGGSYSGTGGFNGEGMLKPSAEAGVVIQRTFVQNNAEAPTLLNISLERGYSISGAITLSAGDAPWHDFGDGTFTHGMPGDPNGRLDTDNDPMKSELISMAADIAGKSVKAIPMEMMFMGGEDPRRGQIQYDPGSGVATFEINGLAPGVYIIKPPFRSERVSQMEGQFGSTHFFDGGQEDHHWTASRRMVVISNQDVTGIDFELGNGHTVTGTITLPEAQTVTQDWENWMWVGHLELETATQRHLGHGKPIFKGDFDNTSRYEFTFNHVANGDYLVRFWTDRYVPGSTKFTVNNANTSVNLSIEEGANLVGKLVDADTGEAITSDDGVRVICEAYPWVDGSWRETRDDPWSQSYIENPDFQQGSAAAGDDSGGQRENKTPGKFHLTSVPTGHKYFIRVEAEHGQKTGGAKNYVGRVIAGIDVPEGASGDIDVGTIELKEGTTIKGRLEDIDGNPIPGVEVFAMPSDAHDGAAEAEGISDTNGYYTVYGVDPDVAYYDLVAAERPDMFEDWGKRVQWGEKRKYNVLPGASDVDFTLIRANASLSGMIAVPSGVDFMLPFKGEGEEFPATLLLLQRKGVIYSDVLDGIEATSVPAPSGVTTTSYDIDHIAPGNYKVIVMNYGLPTKIFDNVAVEPGDNTLDIEWGSAGFTVSGSLALVDGGYPSSADISGVVCMNMSDQSLTFGLLTQQADGTYSAYEVPGLAAGEVYQLVFFKESGYDEMPDIFASGEPFMVTEDIDDEHAVIDRNVTPILMVQAIQNSDDANVIDLGIFSTGYLTDRSIEVVGSAPTEASTAGELHVGTGSGSLGNVRLSGDKRTIRAQYTKAAGDSDVVLLLAVHYGDDATTLLQTIGFNVNTLAKNSDSVSVFLSGQVKLGNGDATQIYVPAGSLDTSDDGKVIITIEKSDEEPGALEGQSRSLADSRGIFAGTAVNALPDNVISAGKQYDFSYQAAGENATATQVSTVTVQIQYDPELVDDIDQLQVMHLVSGNWVQESTNRTIDTDNQTITVDVTSLSPFLAATVSGSGDQVTSPGGGGGGGGCFISSSTMAGANSNAMTVSVLVVLAGILLARRHFSTKKGRIG